jgi:hypothetical protein
METTHNVTLVHFKHMEKSEFVRMLEWSKSMNRERLKKICTRLQVMAVHNGLKVPSCFEWFEGEKIETEVPTFWGKPKKVEKSEFIIALHFEDELNDEEYRIWALILRGVNFGCNPD